MALAVKTQYSKALEQLNKLLKEQRASVKEIKLQLANLRTIKDHAEKLRAEAVDHGEWKERRSEQVESHGASATQVCFPVLSWG